MQQAAAKQPSEVARRVRTREKQRYSVEDLFTDIGINGVRLQTFEDRPEKHRNFRKQSENFYETNVLDPG